MSNIENECLFCKILSKEIPSYKIYEDAKFYAFLDVFPNDLGHTLVIPKKHYENFLDIPNDELMQLMSLTQKLASLMKEIFKADGINIINNSGRAAGQEVFHLHMHIIPRYNKKKNVTEYKNNIAEYYDKIRIILERRG